jgi:hypothetical protein
LIVCSTPPSRRYNNADILQARQAFFLSIKRHLHLMTPSNAATDLCRCPGGSLQIIEQQLALWAIFINGAVHGLQHAEMVDISDNLWGSTCPASNTGCLLAGADSIKGSFGACLACRDLAIESPLSCLPRMKSSLCECDVNWFQRDCLAEWLFLASSLLKRDRQGHTSGQCITTLSHRLLAVCATPLI